MISVLGAIQIAHVLKNTSVALDECGQASLGACLPYELNASFDVAASCVVEPQIRIEQGQVVELAGLALLVADGDGYRQGSFSESTSLRLVNRVDAEAGERLALLSPFTERAIDRHRLPNIVACLLRVAEEGLDLSQPGQAVSFPEAVT